MNLSPRWKPRLALMLWAGMALPPARHVLEASMALQMLVQIPLLAAAGGWLARFIPARIAAGLAACNRSGISGLVLASVAAMVWMLPRMMDAAPRVAWIEAAKFVSVPWLIGVPLALSWSRAGFVVRGLFLAEVIATAFRMGWLYVSSPVRLCSNYLLGDQQLLGRGMLAVGAAMCVWLIWKLMWGRVAVADSR